jgi:hypothetical protein
LGRGRGFRSPPRDWLDAESIAIRQADLDIGYILEQLANLCELKEAPEILDRARNLLGRRP